MSYQVTARKWRPQNFDEVVYQDHVSRTLRNSILHGRIHHAYIFSGPRGVGKTTMARILAKALNCVEEPGKTPCNKCENCVEITRGNSFDVIEIDGASNNGVDDIRELRENVNFAPVKSKYKIYIIDEVHMVTTQAFNALLKTLEEPPEHVKFIFATTEVHKIPDTILSRCQKFFFKNIPVEKIVEHLKLIAEKEKYNISTGALYPIARTAEGSMRDAQSLLDQVVSFSGSYSDNKLSEDAVISEEDAMGILGVVPEESFIRLLGYIADSDSIAVIDEIDRVIDLGIDLPRFVDGFAAILRAVRLEKNNISIQSLMGLSEDEVKAMKGAASKFNDEELGSLFNIAVKLQRDLKFTNNDRINIEMALLDMIFVKKMPSISRIIEKIESSGLKNVLNNAAGGAVTSASTASGKSKININDNNTGSIDESRKNTRGDIQASWGDFLLELNNNNKYLHFILKSAKIDLAGDTLFINFNDKEDETYYDNLLEPGNISLIEKGIVPRFGTAINVHVGIKNKTEQKEATSQNKITKKEPVPIKAKTNEKVSKNMNPVKSGREDPAIEKIKNKFHGEEIQKGE